MKRLRCPKCDESILFDETRYAPGRVLVFVCPLCNKQFKIRIPSSIQENKAVGADETVYGSLIVIENAFHYKQVISLKSGRNVIGRYVKGTGANAAIKTVDPSIDTTHCIIDVSSNQGGKVKFTLRDAPSNTGTFLHNVILGDKEQATLTNGDVITIGATTMIVRTELEEEEKHENDR